MDGWMDIQTDKATKNLMTFSVWAAIPKKWANTLCFEIQLSPAVTVFKGEMSCISYQRISIITNKGNIKKYIKGTNISHPLKADFLYSWVLYNGFRGNNELYQLSADIHYCQKAK